MRLTDSFEAKNSAQTQNAAKPAMTTRIGRRHQRERGDSVAGGNPVAPSAGCSDTRSITRRARRTGATSRGRVTSSTANPWMPETDQGFGRQEAVDRTNVTETGPD